MKIKRLEIQGFKSFKDRTVIHFDHTITGIVGPNGCGKSNIVDAFFWVMGEQSYKHMRGSTSSDLIFNGSAKYAPLSMAEATLVMETSDLMQDALKKKEISVTRRMYRSGECDYLINGSLARLKDIHELFMDTGVGTKGYSVIEQGQIGKIVNSKPEERRLLIEEAAGIAKYKARKKESLRKMEATQANLARLTDIVREIEKNVHLLEGQAHKAKAYLEYKQQLFENDIKLGHSRVTFLDQKFSGLQTQWDALNEKTHSLDAALQTSENELEVTKVFHLERSKAVEELTLEVEHENTLLAQQQNRLELSRQKQDSLVMRIEELNQQKRTLEAQTQDYTTQVQETEKELHTLQAQSHEIETKLQAQQAEFLKVKKQCEMLGLQEQTVQKEFFSDQTMMTQAESKLYYLKQQVELMQSEQDDLESEHEDLLEKIHKLEQEYKTAENQKNDVLSQSQTLQRQLEEQKQLEGQLQLQITEIEKRSAEHKIQKAQLDSRLQSLQELVSSLDGLGSGAKTFKAFLQKEKISLDFFIDKIKVKKGYEELVEIFLGSRLSAILLDDIHKVQFITQTPWKERIQFEYFPGIKEEKKLPVWVLETFEGCIPMREVVTVTHSAFENIFKNAWIVETLNPLWTIKKLDDLAEFHLVAKNGMAWLGPSTLICGSGSSPVADILKRKSEMEVLQAEQISYEDLLKKDMQLWQEASLKKENFKKVYTQQQQDLQLLHMQASELKTQLQQLERLQKEYQQQQSKIELQRSQKEEAVENSLEEQSQWIEKIENLKSKQKQILERLHDVQTERKTQQTLFETLDRDFQELHLRKTAYQEQHKALQKDLALKMQLLQQTKEQALSSEKQLLQAQNDQKVCGGGEAEAAEQLHLLTESIYHKKQNLAQLKDEVQKADQQISTFLETLKKTHKERDEVQKQFTQVEVEKEKHRVERQNLLEGFQEKYSKNLLECVLEGTQGLLSALEQKELQQVTQQLREKMKKMGEVNPMAIEEYEQTKARFDHLKQEKQDLEKSLKNLQEAIEHINKTSEVRFQQAFDAIAVRFEKLFPIIFGGGQAKLELVKKEGVQDILEAGVDILAQPPGKKVSNITLLSGGEKALTAISLIFAIFMVKPSPFCLLDEVDAPLDDANIGRFNALLREMSTQSQFILITHNKKTMELNDTLYGVTMEEPGVSKMVSIQLH